MPRRRTSYVDASVHALHGGEGSDAAPSSSCSFNTVWQKRPSGQGWAIGSEVESGAKAHRNSLASALRRPASAGAAPAPRPASAAAAAPPKPASGLAPGVSMAALPPRLASPRSPVKGLPHVASLPQVRKNDAEPVFVPI